MWHKILKRTTEFFLIVFIIALLGIALSPFKKHKTLAREALLVETVINVPVKQVYDYLGNSSHAKDWSSYVDHITALNTDSFQDGRVGSRRRSYKYKNEKGMQWDELITKDDAMKLRQLWIYHLVNFPLEANQVATEQRYFFLEPKQTLLQFTLFFHQAPSHFDYLKMKIVAYYIERIFEKNLRNIKSILEKDYMAVPEGLGIPESNHKQ